MRAGAAAVLALLLFSLPAAAAQIAWTGAADSNWNNAANWSPAQVPTAADDAVIDANSTARLNAGDPAISFASLRLGNSGGSTAPTLILAAGNASPAGHLVIHGNATLRHETAERARFASVTVHSGGRITHAANSSSRQFVVDLETTGDLTLLSGANIVLDGLGYGSASGPGAGPNIRAGGGHGGVGGIGYQSAQGGIAYGSLVNPTDLGSGGGGPNASGGGAVILDVGGALRFNGNTISAGGLSPSGSAPPGYQPRYTGAGAGGTINISAGSLSGAATLTANGGSGDGGYGGGGGAGGRIRVSVTGADSSALTLRPHGAGGYGGTAGAGTVLRARPGQTDLIVSNGEWGPSDNLTPITAAIAGSPAPFFDSLSADNARPSFDESVAGTLGTLSLGAGGMLYAVRLTVTGDVVLSNGATLSQCGLSSLVFAGNVTLQSGSLITHKANSGSLAHAIDLDIAGSLTLLSGSAIRADGLGYAGGGPSASGSGPGAGAAVGSAGGGGAGHGGVGGEGGIGSAGGIAYESLTDAADLGSGGAGGAGSYGGAGGGLITLRVTGSLANDGAISANGSAGTGAGHGGGGGSGGSVRFARSSPSGSGSISANGGSGGSASLPAGVGGGGGGGRIVGAAGFLGSLSAAGGAGYRAGQAGTAYDPGAPAPGFLGAASITNVTDSALTLNWDPNGNPPGTFYQAFLSETPDFRVITASAVGTDPSATLTTPTGLVAKTLYYGQVAAMRNGVVASAFTQLGSAQTLASPGQTWIGPSGGDWNNPANWDNGAVPTAADPVKIDADVTVVSQPGAPAAAFQSLTLGDSAGVYAPTLSLSAVDPASPGSLVLHPRSTFVQNSVDEFLLSSVEAHSGSLIKHTANPSGNTRTYAVNIRTVGDFTMRSGAAITVDNLGYKGGNGPGAGQANCAQFSHWVVGSGGAHGAAGAPGQGCAQLGSANDSFENPTELGSGGGPGSSSSGGAGGGAILLKVGGALSMEGNTISADGGIGGPSAMFGGTGAGGSINIAAGSLTGSGTLRANGGSNANGSFAAGGPGAGGRIAVAVSGAKSLDVAFIVDGGRNDFGQAAPGTVYLPNWPLTQLVVTPASADAAPGQSVQFQALGTFGAPPSRALGPADGLLWSIDASSVATLNSSGLATGVACGKTRVVASAGVKQSTATLTVPPDDACRPTAAINSIANGGSGGVLAVDAVVGHTANHPVSGEVSLLSVRPPTSLNPDTPGSINGQGFCYSWGFYLTGYPWDCGGSFDYVFFAFSYNSWQPLDCQGWINEGQQPWGEQYLYLGYFPSFPAKVCVVNQNNPSVYTDLTITGWSWGGPLTYSNGGTQTVLQQPYSGALPASVDLAAASSLAGQTLTLDVSAGDGLQTVHAAADFTYQGEATMTFPQSAPQETDPPQFGAAEVSADGAVWSAPETTILPTSGVSARVAVTDAGSGLGPGSISAQLSIDGGTVWTPVPAENLSLSAGATPQDPVLATASGLTLSNSLTNNLLALTATDLAGNPASLAVTLRTQEIYTSPVSIEGNPELVYQAPEPLTAELVPVASDNGTLALGKARGTGLTLVSNLYELGPEHVVFSPPAIAVFYYDPLALAARNILPSSLAVYDFDAASGLWISLGGVLDEQNHSLTVTIYELASIVAILADETPPTVLVTSPTANAAGWYNAPVTVSFSGEDFGSGLASCSEPVTLGEGANQSATGSCTDKAGNTATLTVEGINIDQTPPEVAITSPANGALTNQLEIAVSWTVDGVEQTAQTAETLSQEGANTITRSFTDLAGNSGSASITLTRDTTPPDVAIASPADGGLTNQLQVAVNWSVDGIAQTDQTSETLGAEGPNVITRSAADAAGNIGAKSITVTRDTIPPDVAIASPADGSLTNQLQIAVSWTVDGAAQTEQTLESLSNEGDNTITRTATDAAGNTGTASITVTRDTIPPEVLIASPADGTLTNQTAIAVSWSVDEEPQTAQTSETLTIEGANTITRSSVDAAGNLGSKSITVTRDTIAPASALTAVGGRSFERFGQTYVTPDTAFSLEAADPDPGSGVASIHYSLDGGALQAYSGPFTLLEGSHLISYHSRDAAGNAEASRSAAYNVSAFLDSAASAAGALSVSGGSVLTGKVAAGGALTASGNAAIQGDATAPSITLNGKASITGARTTAPAPVHPSPFDLAAALADAAASNRNADISAYLKDGVLTLTKGSLALSEGTYFLRGLSLSGGASVSVLGKVGIFVSGPISLSGKARLNDDPLGDAENLALFSNSPGVSVTGGSRLGALLYAPAAQARISGSSQFGGHLFAASLDLSGDSALAAGSAVPAPGKTAGTADLAADSDFALRDLYAFPNPARREQKPTIRLQVGLADSVDLRIYDISGQLLHSASLDSPVILDDGNGSGPQYTYDHAWDTGGAGSGVYLYVISAKKSGSPDIRKSGKVAVIK